MTIVTQGGILIGMADQRECGARFVLAETVTEDKKRDTKTIGGYLYCSMVKCPISEEPTITEEVGVEGTVDVVLLAEARILSRARAEMTKECLVFISDPDRGDIIPNEILPDGLKRTSHLE